MDSTNFSQHYQEKKNHVIIYSFLLLITGKYDLQSSGELGWIIDFGLWKDLTR